MNTLITKECYDKNKESLDNMFNTTRIASELEIYVEDYYILVDFMSMDYSILFIDDLGDRCSTKLRELFEKFTRNMNSDLEYERLSDDMVKLRYREELKLINFLKDKNLYLEGNTNNDIIFKSIKFKDCEKDSIYIDNDLKLYLKDREIELTLIKNEYKVINGEFITFFKIGLCYNMEEL